jgi:hypothetical protein
LAFIGLGTSYIIVGMCAIVFNRYPHRKETLKKLEIKYGNIDNKKLCKFDGFTYLIGGGLMCSTGIFIEFTKHLSFFMAIIIFLIFTMMAVLYYPIRKKYLGIN